MWDKSDGYVFSFVLGVLITLCVMNGIDKYPIEERYNQICETTGGKLESYDWDHAKCTNDIYFKGETSYNATNK